MRIPVTQCRVRNRRLRRLPHGTTTPPICGSPTAANLGLHLVPRDGIFAGCLGLDVRLPIGRSVDAYVRQQAEWHREGPGERQSLDQPLTLALG